MTGTLYLVATPIGNLEDMSMRAIRTLREADLIAAEDTRNSMKLLQYFDIHTPMTSYHEYNRVEKARTLIDRLLGGANIALITDAGTPGISDPGEVLVSMCREQGIPVTSIPGACAFVNALIISGLPSRRLCFEAFLPMDKDSREKRQREKILKDMETETRTILLYEAPHRLIKTLKDLQAHLGAERRICLCRELTKIHEEAYLTTIGEAIAHYQAEDPRGEFVLVVEGVDEQELRRQETASWEELTVQEHLKFYEEQGMDRKSAMKQAAKDRGLGKRDIYRMLLEAEESSD